MLVLFTIFGFKTETLHYYLCKMFSVAKWIEKTMIERDLSQPNFLHQSTSILKSDWLIHTHLFPGKFLPSVAFPKAMMSVRDSQDCRECGHLQNDLYL